MDLSYPSGNSPVPEPLVVCKYHNHTHYQGSTKCEAHNPAAVGNPCYIFAVTRLIEVVCESVFHPLPACLLQPQLALVLNHQTQVHHRGQLLYAQDVFELPAGVREDPKIKVDIRVLAFVVAVHPNQDCVLAYPEPHNQHCQDVERHHSEFPVPPQLYHVEHDVAEKEV